MTATARPTPEVITDPDDGGIYAVMVETDDIAPHPSNIRRAVGDLTELRASIVEHGIIQPLLVAPNPDADGPPWVLVAGHRRFAAAEAEALLQVPVVIRPDLDTEAKVIEAMLTENLHRADLTPVEEADAYKRLVLFDYTPEQIAQKAGRSVSTVRRRLHLATLPTNARDALYAGQITLRQADAIAETVAPEDTEAVDKLVAAVAKGPNEVELVLDRLHRAAEHERVLAQWASDLHEAGHTLLRAASPGAKVPGWNRDRSVRVSSPAEVIDGAEKGVTLILDVYGVNNHWWYRAKPDEPAEAAVAGDGEVPGQQSVEDELAAQRAAQAQAAVDQRTADLQAAAEIRTKWLRKILTQRPSTVTVATMLRQMIADAVINLDDIDLLGLDGDVEWFEDDVRREQANAWSTPRLVQVLWAMVIYRPHHLSDSPAFVDETREYLAQLKELGYELTSVEAAFLAPDAAGESAGT